MESSIDGIADAYLPFPHSMHRMITMHCFHCTMYAHHERRQMQEQPSPPPARAREMPEHPITKSAFRPSSIPATDEALQSTTHLLIEHNITKNTSKTLYLPYWTPGTAPQHPRWPLSSTASPITRYPLPPPFPYKSYQRHPFSLLQVH